MGVDSDIEELLKEALTQLRILLDMSAAKEGNLHDILCALLLLPGIDLDAFEERYKLLRSELNEKAPGMRDSQMTQGTIKIIQGLRRLRGQLS